MDGTLEVIPLGGYNDPANAGEHDDFVLVQGTALGGQFDDVSYDGSLLSATFSGSGFFRSHVGEGLFRIVEYGPNDVTFINYQALPGDANGDLVVDVTDFNIWNVNKFTGGTDWITGDFNGDGVTDVTDFNVWNNNKFTSAGRAAVVAEPLVSVWMLLWLLIPLQRQRRLCRAGRRA